jgi:hypothetical protein
MKCPYFCNSKQITTVEYDYDVEGHEVKHKTVFGEEQHLTECPKEECGAWRDNGCHYKSS